MNWRHKRGPVNPVHKAAGGRESQQLYLYILIILLKIEEKKLLIFFLNASEDLRILTFHETNGQS